MLAYFYEIQMSIPKSASKTWSHIQSTVKYIKKHVMREKVPFCQNFPIKIQEPEETNFLGDNWLAFFQETKDIFLEKKIFLQLVYGAIYALLHYW